LTPQIALTLAILSMAIILFITERIRIDLVALLVLASLALTGLVTPAEALSGFSNPAVITVWAIFILSGGLARTGVANSIGRQVLRLAGDGEIRLLMVIMVAAGLMSAFMNNVGVAALLLPVVIDISRRTRRNPSKLLMPLAFGCLLGGLTTLIGTPPNILASDALRDFGLQPFDLFDFAPVGVFVLLGGILYMLLIGRTLLPERDMAKEFHKVQKEFQGDVFDLSERLFILRLPEQSTLSGRTLAETRLGSALGLNVIGLIRGGETKFVPGPESALKAGDRLLVAGRLDRLNELGERLHLTVKEERLDLEEIISEDVHLIEVALTPNSSYIGQSLRQMDFRNRYKANVLAIMRDGKPHRTHLQDIALKSDDILLIQATQSNIQALRQSPDFSVSSTVTTGMYHLQERLLMIGVPDGSSLVGKSLSESRLADAFGFSVLGILREKEAQLIPDPDERLQASDTLIVEGKAEDLKMMQALQKLELDRKAALDLEALESERVGLIEAMLSPYTTLVDKSPEQLHFREKYGLNVLAIWRAGKAYRSNISDMPLRFGDTLLLHGPREKLKMLAEEPDFLVLSEEVQEPLRLDKAPIAALVMIATVLSVLAGWLSIAIAAVSGAAVMVLTGCLNMEEAYRYIDWRAVFLIAGMLPLGIAMQNSGAAQYIAQGAISRLTGLEAGQAATILLLAMLFVLTTVASQIMPNPVVVVLMAPIVINTAADLQISPYALMMVVAIAASASFLSPVGHPANLLVMGPGGYRFSDYIKVGLPLSILVLLIVLFILPIFWPLSA
jgi:di/tricarboxylate transporter